MNGPGMIVRCVCGAVEIEALGRPIAGVVCYCRDCQAAAQLIEAMPGASPFRGSDGGTPLIIYRKDRIRCLRGSERLQKLKLRRGSPTNRWVAACCNSAMMVNFDDAKHWVDIFRARFAGSPPPLEMRVCTRSAASPIANPEGLETTRGYSVRLVARLLGARLAMAFTRPGGDALSLR